MARARELGAAVLGTTSPNPAVGAVILAADGTVAGEGATQPPGGPHAEVQALAAGRRAGPRRHLRRHPGTVRAHRPHRPVRRRADRRRGRPRRRRRPGADGAGRRGSRPAAGRRHRRGARASSRTRPSSARSAPWLTGVREHRPQVVWKVAATLDGRVAAADGSSRWITGEPARAAVHRLRATCDAVVVGSGTAVTDDPQLTVRDADGQRRRRGSRSGSSSTAGDGCRRRPRPGRRRPHAGQPRRRPGRAARRAVRPRRPPGAARGRPHPGRRLPPRRAWWTRPWCTSRRSSWAPDPRWSATWESRTIADALSFETVEILPVGGDVQLRLRPTRHTGARQSVREGS